MGDVVDIRPHLRTCSNCRWSNGSGICQRPGGWWFDSKSRHCATFERKEVIDTHEKP